VIVCLRSDVKEIKRKKLMRVGADIVVLIRIMKKF
jgi:hypothetical protein